MKEGFTMQKYTLEEVFQKGSPVTQKVLRGYVERHKMIPYSCEICGCDGKWQNGKMGRFHQNQTIKMEIIQIMKFQIYLIYVLIVML